MDDITRDKLRNAYEKLTNYRDQYRRVLVDRPDRADIWRGKIQASTMAMIFLWDEFEEVLKDFEPPVRP